MKMLRAKWIIPEVGRDIILRTGLIKIAIAKSPNATRKENFCSSFPNEMPLKCKVTKIRER